MADEFAIIDDDDNGGGVPADAKAGGADTAETGSIIEEKSPVTPESAAQPAAMPGDSFAVSEEEWTALKAQLDKRYTEIANLLRYNKTRDESIQRLSAEVQKYRDGFAYSALKPFISALISLREDCYKTIRDAKEFGIDDAKAKKHIDILVSDFEEMLSNVGLERKEDGSIALNGKPLSGAAKERVLPEELPAEEQKGDAAAGGPLADVEAIKSATELIDYLAKSEEAIRAALADNAVVDKTIQAYRELAARTDAEHYFALVGPVARKLFVLCDKISAVSKPVAESSGEKLIKFHDEFFEKVAKNIGIVLSIAGVVMERQSDGSLFDTQKNKLLKAVPTDDEEQDRVIANIYTDCYTYDDKVIYQSKVDVYKFQQEKQGE